MPISMFYFLTATATLVTYFAIRSSLRLKQDLKRTQSSHSENFRHPLSFIFDALPDDPAIKKRQKSVVWLFCLAILLYWLARQMLRTSIGEQVIDCLGAIFGNRPKFQSEAKFTHIL